MSAEVRYDYRDGLDFDRYAWDRDATLFDLETVSLPPEALLPDQFEAEVARIEEGMRDNWLEAPATHGGKQRKIRYRLLNQDKESDDGHIYPYYFQWGGSANNPLGQREGAFLAATFPNKHWAVIDLPGAGGADRLPASITREIARTGSFIPYGEFAVQALGSLFDGYDGVGLRGDSMGARMSLGMAPHLERRVKDAVLNDPPGSHHLGRLGIAKAFMTSEGAHNAEYVKASLDEKSREAQRNNDTPKNFLTVMSKLALSGGMIDQFWRQPQAMGRAGLERDLRAALPHISEELVINSPELSELTNSGVVGLQLSRLAQVKNRPRLVQNVINGRTHSYPAGNPVVRARALMNWQ